MALKKGDLGEGFATSDTVFEGEISTGAQEHFYLETFSTLVTPGEGGEIEVLSATQAPTSAQVRINRQRNVNCLLKRPKNEKPDLIPELSIGTFF